MQNQIAFFVFTSAASTHSRWWYEYLQFYELQIKTEEQQTHCCVEPRNAIMGANIYYFFKITCIQV